MRIRRALSDEAEKLTQIAHNAKRHWGYPEHWIKHWQADLTISPDYISNNSVYVADEAGELIGFYALAVHADKAELDHMWVAPEHIGTGVGKELFIDAMQRAAERNLSAMEISADPNAASFYLKMGATKVGEITSEIDGQARVLPRLKIDPNNS